LFGITSLHRLWASPSKRLRPAEYYYLLGLTKTLLMTIHNR
jgi:hypothetical protein